MICGSMGSVAAVFRTLDALRPVFASVGSAVFAAIFAAVLAPVDPAVLAAVFAAVLLAVCAAVLLPVGAPVFLAHVLCGGDCGGAKGGERKTEGEDFRHRDGFLEGCS